MNKYWFRKRQGLKSKDYGWGWVPISWEGWILVLVSVALVFTSAFVLFRDNIATDVNPTLTTILIYIGVVILLVSITSVIAHKKTRP